MTHARAVDMRTVIPAMIMHERMKTVRNSDFSIWNTVCSASWKS
jgi:hypothetical protein